MIFIGKMKLLTLIFSLFSISLFSQGIIINEFSNGTTGNREYYELLVIGSAANPLANVNLNGWIVDDNNGSFEGSIAGVGIAQGHIRISSTCLSSVKPGSIILIYNSAELLFTNDETDSNQDCIYIFSINSPCLEHTTTLPITTNPNYSPATYTAFKNWSKIGLRNDGDAAQTRKPDGTFYHGFAYGDVTAPFPNFPLEFGGTSSFNIPLTGAGMAYSLNCGNFTSVSNFTIATASTSETPGAPNNNQNRYLINSIRNGTYDYSNLSNAANCGSSATLTTCETVLPIELNYFKGNIIDSYAKLEWQTSFESDGLYFEVEKSYNGIDWTSIGTVECNNIGSTYEIYDYNFESNYYRLKSFDIFGSYEILKTIFLEKEVKQNIIFSNEQILVSDEFISFQIYLLNGSPLSSGKINNNSISISNLPNGTYIVSLRTKSGVINKIFYK